MLRKFTFLAGAGVGYVLGTRAGREQYGKIEEIAKQAADRPELQHALDKAAPFVTKVKAMAAERMAGVGGGSAVRGGASPADESSDDREAADETAAAGAGPTVTSEPAPRLAAPRTSSETGAAGTSAGAAEEAVAPGTPGHSNLPPRGTFSPTHGTF